MNSETDTPVLIIGATGFAGGALAKRLRDQGRPVRAMVRPSSDTTALKAMGAELVEGDITDPAAVDRAVAGSSTVYNFASPFRSATPTLEYFRKVNRDGALHVAEAVQKHGVPRYVHCSTIGVHGHVQEIPCTETSPFNPGDDYQDTKLEAEVALQEMIKGGLPAVIMRPASMYGPGDTRMLKMFRMVKKGSWFTVGDGSAWFHPAYIDDLTAGFQLCGEHPDAVGEVFIMAGPEPIHLRDLVKRVAESMDAPYPTRRVPLGPMLMAARACEAICKPFGIEPPLYERRVRFFTNDRNFDDSKARRVLGYEPRTPLPEGLKRTADWYAANGYLN